MYYWHDSVCSDKDTQYTHPIVLQPVTMSLYILISDSLDYTKYSRIRVNTTGLQTCGEGEGRSKRDISTVT